MKYKGTIKCYHACKDVGFTLIEIMLVMVIIGLLAAFAIPRLAGKGKEARISAASFDIESNIRTALSMYELDNGLFPSSEQGLDALLNKPSGEPAPMHWNGPYLEKKPKDPWARQYAYKYPGDHNKNGYDLFSLGPDGLEGTSDDIANWDSDE
ncbi:MAG: type II secretion system major pseudopilin GspG [Chlamydiota bacterium]|nr:type II secretion system major pseudopilin GspG [Chlamydiota bacterium]